MQVYVYSMKRGSYGCLLHGRRAPRVHHAKESCVCTMTGISHVCTASGGHESDELHLSSYRMARKKQVLPRYCQNNAGSGQGEVSYLEVLTFMRTCVQSPGPTFEKLVCGLQNICASVSCMQVLITAHSVQSWERWMIIFLLWQPRQHLPARSMLVSRYETSS